MHGSIPKQLLKCKPYCGRSSKSVETIAPVHKKQVLTYLRLLNLPVGLLINFGAATLKEGLQRIVNNLPPSASPRLRVNKPLRGNRP